MPPLFCTISTSALYAPSDGYAFIASSSAFVCAEEGINEKGLAVGMTYVWGKQLKAGLSSMFLVRYILEKCTTVKEGINAILNNPIGGAYHLILADNNEIAHAECSPRRIKVHQGDWAIASNHFVSDEMKEYETDKNLYNSHQRYNKALVCLEQHRHLSSLQQGCFDLLRPLA